MVSRTPAPDAHLHRSRTEPELRGTLARFCEAAWYPTRSIPIFSIPPQPDDADMVLSDGIDELVALRAEVVRTRGTIAQIEAEIAELTADTQRLMTSDDTVHTWSRRAALQWVLALLTGGVE